MPIRRNIAWIVRTWRSSPEWLDAITADPAPLSHAKAVKYKPAEATDAYWKDGKKIANARITMWWNGVKVHDYAEVSDKTGMSPAEAEGDHPLLLQAHETGAVGPVRYRNVWVVRE